MTLRSGASAPRPVFEMPGFLEPSVQHQSHAQTLREEPLRHLSRSPHPYHRQHFEIPYASERIIAPGRLASLPGLSGHHGGNEREGSPKYQSDRYREPINSDSGTEADDEHFLKRLPAPRRRPHKGLREDEGRLSGASTPAILDEELPKSVDNLQRTNSSSLPIDELVDGRTAAKLRQKRRLEVARRATEAALLVFVGSVLTCNPSIKRVIQIWSQGEFGIIIMWDKANLRRIDRSISSGISLNCAISTKSDVLFQAACATRTHQFRSCPSTLSSSYIDVRFFAIIN